MDNKQWSQKQKVKNIYLDEHYFLADYVTYFIVTY